MTQEVNIAVELAGIKLVNPVIVPSGIFGYGHEFSRIADFAVPQAGAVVLKSVTLEPWQGNPPPRVAETPSGMLNSIGLQNPGVDAFVKDVLPALHDFGPKVFANIAGHSQDEYARVARKITASPDAGVLSAIEVNISCPNVKQGGLAFGSDPEAARTVVQQVKNETSLPVIAKLTPAAPDITAVAQACIDGGADILSLINTVPGMVVDTVARRPLLGNGAGGLSGPAIRPIAVLLVRRVYKAVKDTGTPLIGMGGINNADDALQFILAGATAVGVGSALFWNYQVCSEVAGGLRERLASEKVSDLAQLVGALHE